MYATPTFTTSCPAVRYRRRACRRYKCLPRSSSSERATTLVSASFVAGSPAYALPHNTAVRHSARPTAALNFPESGHISPNFFKFKPTGIYGFARAPRRLYDALNSFIHRAVIVRRIVRNSLIHRPAHSVHLVEIGSCRQRSSAGRRLCLSRWSHMTHEFWRGSFFPASPRRLRPR